MCDLKFFVCFAAVNLAVIGFGKSEGEFDLSNILNSRFGPKTGALIIDTDAGTDDAVAIFNLLGEEELFQDIRIQSITTVHGNTNVDNVSINVLKILKTADRLDIPVYKGASQSLLRTPETDHYFGKDGFGDFYFPDPPTMGQVQKQHAANALVEQATLHPGELTLICLGPLTNIALAIRLDDTFFKKLKEIYILGGSDSGVGNIQPGVEFNFYMDPEAVSIVFKEAEKANKTLTLLPWETAFVRSVVDREWRNTILGAIRSPQVELLNKAENLTNRGTVWVASDCYLTAVVIDRKIVESEDVFHGDVEVCGSISRGSLFVDYKHSANLTRNIRIVQKINEEMYKKMLLRNLNPRAGEKNCASKR